MSEIITKATRRHRRVQSTQVLTGGLVSNYGNLYAWTDTFSGQKNPNWRNQIKRVTQAGTPMNGIKTSLTEFSPGMASAAGFNSGTPSNPRNFQSCSFYGFPGIGAPNTVPPSGAQTISGTEAYNQAVQRLYQRLTNLSSPARLGEDFGELRQTLELLTHPAHSAQKFFRSFFKSAGKDLSLLSRKAYRQSRRVRNNSVQKMLSDTYLEYQYGWRPLQNSVASALVGLQNRKILAYYHPFYAGSGTMRISKSLSSGIRAVGELKVSFVTTLTDETSCQFYGVYKEQADLDQRGVAQTLGLTPGQFLPTIWNLIPYSFLVDYVTNIGTFVDSVGVPWGQVAWCCKTARAERFRRYQDTSAGFNVSPVVKVSESFKPAILEWSNKSVDRSLVSGLPYPKLVVSLGLTGQQWTNVGALISSNRERLRQLAKPLLKLIHLS